MNLLTTSLLLDIVFLTIIFLNFSRKNVQVAYAYGLQSLAIAAIMFKAYLETGSQPLLMLVVIIVAIKVIAAPIFFVRLVRKHNLAFSVSTYMNIPLSLIVLAALTSLSSSRQLAPLVNLVPANSALLSIAFSGLLLSLFSIVNGKGALSHIIGVLSLENSIVVFALLAGLEQSVGLQLGIIFDIFTWIVVATMLASMIYEHFGSTDVSDMQHLKD